MPSIEAIIEYINKLPSSERFSEMDTDKQEAYVFNATETLKTHFNDVDLELTDRIVALQTLYMVEGDFDEYTHLKAHGIDSYRVKDVTVSFKDGALNLHPEVHELIINLNPHLIRNLRVGRLI